MIISSVSNPRVKRVRALQTSRRSRHRESAFVLEGARLLQEAVAARAAAQLVLYTDHLDDRGRGLVNQLARQGAETFVVTEQVMRACSTTETPPGLLAVVSFPSLEAPPDPDLVLVVDNLRNPGNLGALLRSALAAGVQVVLLVKGSVDPFNPKVVRGAMGAHFHLPLITVQRADLAQALDGLTVWVADSRKGTPYHTINARDPIAVVIGSEAQGAARAWEGLAAGFLHIPTHATTESLNAAIAGSVILFEIARQRGEP